MGSFILGAALFGHIGHLVHQRRRAWLLGSTFIQTLLVYAAAAIRQWGSQARSGPLPYAIIGLLAAASGGQIGLAVCVRLPELNTTMVTGALVQLATDRDVLRPANVARNRRLVFFGALLAGAFAGAAATTFVSGALALLLTALVKTVVCLSFLVNHGMVRRKGGEEAVAVPLRNVLWGD